MAKKTMIDTNFVWFILHSLLVLYHLTCAMVLLTTAGSMFWIIFNMLFLAFNIICATVRYKDTDFKKVTIEI